MNKCKGIDYKGNHCVLNDLHEGSCHNGDYAFCYCYHQQNACCDVCTTFYGGVDLGNQSLEMLYNLFPRTKKKYMETQLTRSTDAKIWAECFVEFVKDNPSIATDEGTMLGWFANAIMNGYQSGIRNS